MSAVHPLPVEFDSTQPGKEAPVVTLLHSDISHAYLEDAEPSPTMVFVSRLWNSLVRTLKWAAILLFLGGYPAAMWGSHTINSETVVLSQTDSWATTKTGIMLTLIGRELTGPGWAADRPAWHPQARLTALPAWQTALSDALSDIAGLAAIQARDYNDRADTDLLAASRLLATASDVKAVPRLNAASEALQSYDSRLGRKMAVTRADNTTLLEEVDLYKGWLQADMATLRQTALDLDGWPASRKDIRAVYAARARAHVAALFLSSSIEQTPELVVSREASAAHQAAQRALDRIARFEPLVISNQGGTHPVLADHPAMLAFYLSEADAALGAFKEALNTQPGQQTAFAQAHAPR